MDANTEVKEAWPPCTLLVAPALVPAPPPAPVGGGDANAGCGEKEKALPPAPEVVNDDLLLRDSGDTYVLASEARRGEGWKIGTGGGWSPVERGEDRSKAGERPFAGVDLNPKRSKLGSDLPSLPLRNAPGELQ